MYKYRCINSRMNFKIALDVGISLCIWCSTIVSWRSFYNILTLCGSPTGRMLLWRILSLCDGISCVLFPPEPHTVSRAAVRMFPQRQWATSQRVLRGFWRLQRHQRPPHWNATIFFPYNDRTTKINDTNAHSYCKQPSHMTLQCLQNILTPAQKPSLQFPCCSQIGHRHPSGARRRPLWNGGRLLLRCCLRRIGNGSRGPSRVC